MPRSSFSQTFTNPVGNISIPGVNNNILLKPGQNDTSGQMSMSEDDLLKILDDISNITNTSDKEKYIPKIDNAIKNFDQYYQDLNAIKETLQNNTGGPITKNLDDGKPLPTGPKLAKELSSRIRSMKTSNVKVFNLHRYAAKSQRSREERDKKKTRGNPFRVLMGQVGKLLDHGISKKDIIRYIAKKNMWNEETISKAVDVVSDYSKKKRKKEKKFQEKEAFYNESNQRTAAIDAKVSIYDVDPDFTKRSTAELMARATWLKDLMDYGVNTPQGDSRKVADKNGASAELRQIREALKLRGFEENELP